MLFLELSGQGLRGFSNKGKVQLRPGYLVLSGQTGSPPPLAELLRALLYPDESQDETSLMDAGSATANVTLTFTGSDQKTYRIIRELGDFGTLEVMDPSSQKFELVSDDAREIAGFLRANAGLPPAGAFDALFSLVKLPSKWPARTDRKSPAPPPPAPAPTGEHAKLAELEKELALAQRLEQVQEESDEVTRQVFDLEHRLKPLTDAKNQLALAEEEYSKAPTPESLGLPADIVKRAEAYPDLVMKRDEALLKLRGINIKEAGLRRCHGCGGFHLGQDHDNPFGDLQKEPEYAVPPLVKDPKFLGGVGGGVALLATGASFSTPGSYVALLANAAFGYSAFVAFKWIQELETVAENHRKNETREAFEKKVKENFEAEGKWVRQAMKTLNVARPDQVGDYFAQIVPLAETIARCKATVAEAEANPEVAEALSKYPALAKRRDELSAMQSESGGYTREIRVIEAELSKLRQKLGVPAQKAASLPPAPAAAVPDDPFEELLFFAAEQTKRGVAAVAELFRERASQYLGALSDGRCQAISFVDGKAAVTQGGKAVPASELAPKDKDLAYLAVKLTAAEKLGAALKMPLVLQDTSFVDEAKLPLLGRMLKHLGTATQVLHVATHPSSQKAADVALTL